MWNFLKWPLKNNRDLTSIQLPSSSLSQLQFLFGFFFFLTLSLFLGYFGSLGLLSIILHKIAQRGGHTIFQHFSKVISILNQVILKLRDHKKADRQEAGLVIIKTLQ